MSNNLGASLNITTRANIIKYLTYDDVLNFCKTERISARACKSSFIWKEWIKHKSDDDIMQMLLTIIYEEIPKEHINHLLGIIFQSKYMDDDPKILGNFL